ncbi:MAG TPA: radical SAM protein [Methanomassiliicoccales archaeon]|nr:radical SAM protein [Methanomassiliicoccales archaeon]
MRPKPMEAGSAYTRSLPVGCRHCRQGSKMVLLVTGRCRSGCFYCPLSSSKKGRKVIFADELAVRTPEDVLHEARSIRAKGTGITGGDPLEELDEVLSLIRLLKGSFGGGHHIHLYTATLDRDAYLALQEAGLDELRIHPPLRLWRKMRSSGLSEAVEGLKMSVGLEVPALPGNEAATEALIRYADSIGLDFVNLNELEFSETNYRALERKGLRVKDDISSAAEGSEELALKMLGLAVSIPIHYCSSSFKDSVQLRNRLRRRAKSVARRWDVITDEGTLIKGVVGGEDAKGAAELLREAHGVPDDLLHWDEPRSRLEVAPWVLRELEGQLPFDSFIVEEYPTADHLEVEREPVRRKGRKRRA